MGGRTRQKVIFGSFDHASPYRISLDITNRIPAMRLLHRKGFESTLPRMANQPIFCVEVAGVFTVSLFYRPSERIFAGRHRYVVDVIVH